MKLTKTIKRETDYTVFERGKSWNLMVSIEPVRGSAVIGVRLKGQRDTYRIGVGSIHLMAVQKHLQAIERKAKQIAKEEKVSIRTARARARKALAAELR